MISSSIIPPFSMFCLAFTLYVFIGSEMEMLLLCCCWDTNHTHKSPLNLLCFNRKFIFHQKFIPKCSTWPSMTCCRISFRFISSYYNINILKSIFCRKENLRNLLLKWILFWHNWSRGWEMQTQKIIEIYFFFSVNFTVEDSCMIT